MRSSVITVDIIHDPTDLGSLAGMVTAAVKELCEHMSQPNCDTDQDGAVRIVCKNVDAICTCRWDDAWDD